MSLINTVGLDVSIADRTICSGLTMAVDDGECWGVMGANGAGKTTLLHTLAGLRPPTSGTVNLQGVDIHSLSRLQIARTLGLLPQDISDPFPATVLETALLGRHPFLKRWEWESDKDHCIARQSLASVNLATSAHRLIDTLSGGERRRVAIATLLTQQPSVMLLDEPTNHLDPYYQIKMLSLLTDHVMTPRPDKHGALIMVIHDINLAARFCSHLLLLMPDGQVMTGSVAELLSVDVLELMYGHPMVRIENEHGLAFLPR